MRPAVVLLCVCLAAASCRDERLLPGEGQVRLSPALLELAEVYPGETAIGALEVQNAGNSALTLEWKIEGTGLSLEAPPDTLPGGAVQSVPVRVSLGEAGAVAGAVTVVGPNNEVRSEIRARAVPPPPCVPSQPCLRSDWSPADRACVERPLPDDTLCADACLANPHCVQGRCVGDVRSCDDGDACTTDLCMSHSGCVHQPGPPCPGDGRCQVGVCNPARGCELAVAPDGHGCGRTDCLAADVCIGGACVERDPPDGFVCAQASPCQEEGKCQQDVCVRPPAVPLAASWETGGPLPDGGFPPKYHSDVLLSPTDEVTLSSYFASEPVLNARAATPVPLTTTARRCIWWGAVLACADHPTTLGAAVSVIDPATGAPRWAYQDVLVDLPHLAGPGKHTFLARLVALSATRLAAVFESRTVNSNGSDTNCRTFSVVVLDRFGAMVSAWTISDPIFTPCNHPHSFGAAADALGNLYLAFTPSANTNPAEPAVDSTLFISFTEAGSQRWKGTVPSLPGGELAVANGVLFHQHSIVALSTIDGSVAGALPSEFHHGVATRGTFIPGPQVGTTALRGFAAPSLAPAWAYTTPAGKEFVSDVARLAQWSTRNGSRSVWLGFVGGSGATSLLAVDADTGDEAFSCPLAVPVDPLLVEIGRNGMAMMSAYTPPQGCPICDPRYAGTRNRFSWYDLPLIERSAEPWSGLLGGPGHDHRED
jgi:hypothetical protein